MRTQIPEGYELLVGRSQANAIQALTIASERNLPPESVLTVTEGYLIPLVGLEILEAEAGEVELPKVTDKVADIEQFAADWGIDLGGAKNNADRIAAIEAEIERRTEAAEAGDLGDGIPAADDDESEKED